jgi:hypothetical protein
MGLREPHRSLSPLRSERCRPQHRRCHLNQCVRIKAGSPPGPTVKHFREIRTCFRSTIRNESRKHFTNIPIVLPVHDTISPPRCNKDSVGGRLEALLTGLAVVPRVRDHAAHHRDPLAFGERAVYLGRLSHASTDIQFVSTCRVLTLFRPEPSRYYHNPASRARTIASARSAT